MKHTIVIWTEFPEHIKHHYQTAKIFKKIISILDDSDCKNSMIREVDEGYKDIRN